MKTWNKKRITKSEIEELQKRYGIDPITASILVRRNITEGKDLLFYLENDLRFQHSPFLFANMEDAVDRILQALEEKEKVLIFGDRDVDGITSTTVLYQELKRMGIDVTYRLPIGDDAYGLTNQIIDEFAANFGSLIITVDCGIANIQEAKHCEELGIDLIITDHHEAQDELPQPAIILDPKTSDSGYPFKGISGCAVAYKLVSALRFSRSELYKQEICLMNIEPMKDSYKIQCLKTKNLVPVTKLEETIIPGLISISQTRLPRFLQGQQIYIWDKDTTQKLLKGAFGSNVEFNFYDIRNDVCRLIPSVKDTSLLRIKDMSRIAKYGNHPSTEIGGFYNIFVSFMQANLKSIFPDYQKNEDEDLQLVALAALADIMPMENENRIFIKHALNLFNSKSNSTRKGLRELFALMNMFGKTIDSTKLGWDVVPALNAAGRLGRADVAAQLFLSEDGIEREKVAKEILELNSQRKSLTLEAMNYTSIQAENSLEQYNNKMCVVIDQRINRGVNGLLAGKLSSQYNVPAVSICFLGDQCIGSIRAKRGVNVQPVLKQFDIFTAWGGHEAAAGFTFNKKDLPEFESKLKKICMQLELEQCQDSDTINVDAEIPESYMNANLFAVIDRLEPYGNKNDPLVLMCSGMTVCDGTCFTGSKEKPHLRLLLQSGQTKWPAMFWNEGERLNRDFSIGDKVDILFQLQRNFFNGVEKPQLILQDIRKSVM